MLSVLVRIWRLIEVILMSTLNIPLFYRSSKKKKQNQNKKTHTKKTDTHTYTRKQKKKKKNKNKKKKPLNYPHLPPDLPLWLNLSDSNCPCLEQIPMIQKMFEPLKFVCMYMKRPLQTHNVVITSFRRRSDVKTSLRHRNDVITTLCVYWVCRALRTSNRDIPGSNIRRWNSAHDCMAFHCIGNFYCWPKKLWASTCDSRKCVFAAYIVWSELSQSANKSIYIEREQSSLRGVRQRHIPADVMTLHRR